jgi:hypothetical protein
MEEKKTKLRINEDAIRPMPPRGVVHHLTRKFESLEHYDDYMENIRRGCTNDQVIQIIREKGEYDVLGMEEGQLNRFLTRARKRLRNAGALQRVITTQEQKSMEVVKNKIDEIAEMEELFLLQKERIFIDYDHEKQIKKLFKTTGNEINIGKEILKELAKLKASIGPEGGRFDPEEALHGLDLANRYGKTIVNTVILNANSRKKVLGIFEKVMQDPILAKSLLNQSKKVESQD